MVLVLVPAPPPHKFGFACADKLVLSSCRKEEGAELPAVACAQSEGNAVRAAECTGLADG